MCGICGKVNFEPERKVEGALVDRMMRAIQHRGPDGEGKYLAGQVGLGHTRLAIIDLGSGDQPMTNEDGSIWLVYNGEIYNFPELRCDLLARGHTFRSHSDTEVIIHLYEEYGPECVQRLRGMFAFALWDANTRALLLARDRLGVKPLYYANTGKALVFGSEIKTLLCDPEVKREINPDAILRFLSFLYLPGRETLLCGIEKLEPGHYLVLKDGKTEKTRYWNLKFRVDEPPLSFRQASDLLREKVEASVREHLLSDVPVGVLLSGGVDSTVVLACASKHVRHRINTFTIGFGGEEFDDERPYARMAAERFNSEHHEITISPADFSSFLPRYIRHLEEPVCEAPAVALHYVSELARKHVKVVLSGEGGDEGFAGYQTYRNQLLLENMRRAAGPWRAELGSALEFLGRQRGLSRLSKYAPLVNVPLSSYYFGRTGGPFGYFRENLQTLCTPEFLAGVDHVDAARFTGHLFAEVQGQFENQPVLNQMLYVDTKTWLPDDLLIKADKMTMANSLELRVPLLDHGLLEFAAGLPPNYKVRGWNTKRILKAAFKGIIPDAIIHRRKTGLPVPLRRWMRGDLASYVREVLLSREALERGYFTRAGVEKLLADNDRDGSLMKYVFALLTLELWHREFADA